MALALASPALFGPSGRAAITTPYSPSGAETVAPGVEYEWGLLHVNGSRREINIVELDSARSQIDLRLAQADGVAANRDTVVDQAAAYSRDGRRVVATVNGSLFSYLPDGHGAGLGLNVSDGELINAGNPSPRPELPAFGLDGARTPVIGAPQVELTLTLAGSETVALDRINQRRVDGEGDVVLYTPRFGSQTWTDEQGTEFVIEGFELPLAVTGTYTGTVVEIRRDTGNTTIGPGQVILSVSDTASPWSTEMAIGSEVSLTVAVNEPWRSVTHSVGGRDMLVVNGQSVVAQPDTDGTHPRTAAGIDADGHVILVTADDGSYSRGLTLTDLAQLMLSLGAVDALNLDGGGSAQMAVRLPGDVEASIVNSDDTSVDRPVVNALQVVSSAPTGPLDRLIAAPKEASVEVGQSVDFTAKGRDAGLNGVVVDPSTLDWSISRTGGGAGDGAQLQRTPTGVTVTAHQPGDYVVRVRTGGVEATALLTVRPDTKAPTASKPELAIIASGPVSQNGAQIGVAWTANDNVGIVLTEVQRRFDSGLWKNVSISDALAETAAALVGFGQKVQFRVRVTDGSGNSSGWISSSPYRLTLFDDKHTSVLFTGTWTKKTKSEAIAGSFKRSRNAGASASLTFTGIQVAAVGSTGPDRGQADVYLAGQRVASVSLGAASAQFRQIMYVSPIRSASTPTTVNLVNTSPAATPLLPVDAFLVLMPAS